jgi:hypothetical protein
MRQLTSVSATYLVGSPSWLHFRLVLTFTDVGQQSIIEVDVTTGERTTLLTDDVPFAEIWSIAWTTDDRRLVFVLSGFQNPDYTPPPATLYVYSPAALRT